MQRLLLLMAVAPFAVAVVAASETVSFTSVDSQASSGLVTYNVDLLGGYTLGAIDWEGFASTLQDYTYGSELRLGLSGPLGSGEITLGSGGSYAPGSAFSGSSNLFSGAGDPAGTWTFDFYESYDDGGDGLPDATWDYIDFLFGDWSPPEPPTCIGDFGNPFPGSASQMNYLNEGEVHWYSITMPDIVGDNGDILTIDTEGSVLTPSSDSELGLYDALGNQIAIDDDGGSGLLSLLSFGSGGSDGDLAAGDYYICASGYSTTHGATGWDVTSSSTRTGDLFVNVYSNVPEPGALALLALGGLALLRRR